MTLLELCTQFYACLLRRKDAGMSILPTEEKLIAEYERLMKTYDD